MERERAKIAECAELAVLILAAKGVRRVLKDDNIVLLGQRHDRIHIDWIAANVDGDDHLRLVGDLFLHVLGIHIQRQRIDIRKHQLAADGKRIRHGCGKRDGRDDNLVSWLQSSILAGNLKARCAVGQKCRASGVQIFVAHILGLANLHVQRQLCRGRGNLVQRENVLLNRFQRLVVGLALAFHHKPDDGHQILRVIVFADRSPRDFGFAGVIPEIRCFLLHLKLTPFRISVC